MLYGGLGFIINHKWCFTVNVILQYVVLAVDVVSLLAVLVVVDGSKKNRVSRLSVFDPRSPGLTDQKPDEITEVMDIRGSASRTEEKKGVSSRGIKSSLRSSNRRNTDGKPSIKGSEEPPSLMLKSAVGLIGRCSYRHSNRRNCSGGGETDEGSLTQEQIHPSLRQGTEVKASYWGRTDYGRSVARGDEFRGGMSLGVWRLGRRGE